MKISKWARVGSITVDAGLCWIGDPCYVLHREGGLPKELGTDWRDFCGKLFAKQETLGQKSGVSAVEWGQSENMRLGVTVSTGYGDGLYDVYVRHDSRGIIQAAMVVFGPDAAQAEGVSEDDD